MGFKTTKLPTSTKRPKGHRATDSGERPLRNPCWSEGSRFHEGVEAFPIVDRTLLREHPEIGGEKTGRAARRGCREEEEEEEAAAAAATAVVMAMVRVVEVVEETDGGLGSSDGSGRTAGRRHGRERRQRRAGRRRARQKRRQKRRR